MDVCELKTGDVVRIIYLDSSERLCDLTTAINRGAVVRRVYGEYFSRSKDVLILCSDVCDPGDDVEINQEFAIIPVGCITSVRRMSIER